MHEQSSIRRSASELRAFDPQFRGMSRLAFSGWTLLSLCLWAGLIETVRLLF
jgi:hypothetical protein